MITYSYKDELQLLDTDNYYIQTETDGWDNTLNFTIPVSHTQTPHLKERLRMTVTDEIEGRKGQIYAISGYNKSGTNLTISAELDLTELCSDMCLDYSTGDEAVTLAVAIEGVLPDAWSLIDNTVDRDDTQSIEDFCGTPLEFIKEAISQWEDVAAQFDNVQRTVTLYSTDSGTSKGAYFTTDLNLTETPSVKGTAKAGTYYTRLYLRGKDESGDAVVISAQKDPVSYSGHTLTIGDGYVQDLTYDTRIISAYEEDTSITDADILLSTAKHMIVTAAEPQRTYTCKLINLAKLKPTEYDFLDFGIYDIVVLIDPDTYSRTYQTITRTKIYPHWPEKDSVNLSTVPGTLTRSLARADVYAKNAQAQAALAKTQSDTSNATAENALEKANAANDTATTAKTTSENALKTANAAAEDASEAQTAAQTAVTNSKSAVDTATEVSTQLTQVKTDYVSKDGLNEELAQTTNYTTLKQTVDGISSEVTTIKGDYVTGEELTNYSSITSTDEQITLKVGETTKTLTTTTGMNSAISDAKTEAVNTAAADATSKADAAKTGAINDAAEKYVGNSEVRQKFADSTESSITINKGTITFESGTLIIKSDNFTLDADGSAAFSGSLNVGNGLFEVAKNGKVSIIGEEGASGIIDIPGSTYTEYSVTVGENPSYENMSLSGGKNAALRFVNGILVEIVPS